MKKAVIIGAGKTGRGFLSDILEDTDLVFIDKNSLLVNELNEKKFFSISYFGDIKPRKTVAVKAAYTWNNIPSNIFEGALIFVSVGGSNLSDVGVELAKYIDKNNRIIVCENASKPAQKLREAIGNPDIEIAESTVFCTTIEREKGSTDINSEGYPYLQYDAGAFSSELIGYPGLKGIKAFGGFLDRKLFTYNSASCIIAYLGALKGYTIYSDAANDPEILSLLDRNYEIINECICNEYGYTKEDQAEFALLSRRKFTNKTLVDTIARNAREPQRKITAKERIVKPLNLEIKYGKDSSVLEKTLAAALLYSDPSETEWNAILAEKGYSGVLSELCELSSDSAVYSRVLKMAETGKILN